MDATAKPSLGSHPSRHLDIGRKRLQLAIECGEIYPAFQPIVALGTGAVAGFEILARWQSQEFGAVPTKQFIELAEQTDLILLLSVKLVDAALRSAIAWVGGSIFPSTSRHCSFRMRSSLSN
ncbi:MAG: hypothetical protein DI537_22165 [Stutzerimonas stutzeri]|nr:MAG: hypothetical protein DI537_22165 [Stutzerimonas stutzeri]